MDGYFQDKVKYEHYQSLTNHLSSMYVSVMQRNLLQCTLIKDESNSKQISICIKLNQNFTD